MDIIDINKYNEFKHILSGCKNIKDAKYFGNLYITNNPETKKLIIGLLNGKKYYECKDFKTMQKLIMKCDKCEYYDEVCDIIKEYFPDKEDKDENYNIQYKTLMRIANSKKQYVAREDQNNSLLKKNKTNMIKKLCPHCSQEYFGTNETTHVICGYQNVRRGYDFSGCQKDWCFVCEKMLCKSWHDNKLFLEPNRIHDNECCKKHAFENKKSYMNDYCQCNNKYVIRNKL